MAPAPVGLLTVKMAEVPGLAPDPWPCPGKPSTGRSLNPPTDEDNNKDNKEEEEDHGPTDHHPRLLGL